MPVPRSFSIAVCGAWACALSALEKSKIAFVGELQHRLPLGFEEDAGVSGALCKRQA
jgi:hypothetical protein